MRSICRFIAAFALGVSSLTAHADLEEGQAAPRLDTLRIDGKLITARATEGKVVVQIFWATWCPICASEMPELQKLHDTYKSRGLEIIALSLDRDPGEVSEFWRAYGYTFPVAMRSEDIRQGYGRIVGTPTIYIIDRKGIVRLKHLGHMAYDELDALIKALL